jgi:hypothetical protein
MSNARPTQKIAGCAGRSGTVPRGSAAATLSPALREKALHKAVAAYLALAVDVPWTTIGHGGSKLPIGVARGLKEMGLQPGWPDIQLLHQGRYHGIELKAPGEYPSPVQREVHEAIRAAGGLAAVCRSLEDVAEILHVWGVPLKARPA